jgi:hypothetical protein
VKTLRRGLGLAFLVLLAPASALAESPSPAAHHRSPAAPPDLSSPAAELRVSLDRLLAEHAFLTIEQMRSGLVGGPDFEAAATAVEANSTEVAAAIGSIYGDSAVEPFGEIWRSHIGYLVDFAVALGADDTPAQQQALEGLAAYRARLAEFLRGANPGVELAPITDALDVHTAQLVEFIRAEDAGDHAAAYAIERDAYPHMFEVGDALAKVIANRFPDRYPGVDVAYSAAGTLRVTLDRLLAEHAFLAAEAMRSGAVGAPDAAAALDAIERNSAELQAVVAAAYGDEAADAFRSLWDGHLAGYVDYIEAARANDPAAREGASGVVSDYADQLASFLASANPHLDAAELAALFRTHAEHLTTQVDAFVAGDYDTTYDLVRVGYRHMFDAGEALAIGIATQKPDQFPSDAAAPATNMDPHAGHDQATGAWLPWVLLGILGILLLGTLVLARTRRGLARRN